MIENKVGQELHSKGGGNVMGMLLNEKAYSILSDTLYTNKQRSTAREYITNAYDSHVDAGKVNTPFKVHAPTELEPFFSVQDFGIGLSAEDVESIYCTFFLSTKENTNETNGCFGLGSKSALSVSDSFTVTSVKDGVKVTYSIFKGVDGKPQNKKIFESKTDEANGVTVKVPVKPQDCIKWQNEISELICCFSNVDCNIEKDKFYQRRLNKLDELKYGLINWDHKEGVHEVKMGNVIYPIKNFCSYIKTTSLREKFRVVANKNYILLKANLGDFNIAPSREALSMDDITTQRLSRLVTKFVIDLIRNTKKNYSHVNFDSYWSIRKTFYNTGMWDAINTLPLIYGKHSLYDLERDCTWSSGNQVKVIPFDFKIKGLRTGKSNYGLVYESNCQYDVARIVKKIGSPKVFYGEIYKPTLTMYNANKAIGGEIFHVEDLEDAKLLAEYFCTDVIGTLEEYFPEKPVKKKKTIIKEKFGSLEDRYCLARYCSEGNEHPQTKIDLHEEGICYVEDEWFKDGVCYFKHCNSWKSRKMSNTLKALGYTKIILKNKINSRKVEKAGIPFAADIINNYITKNKVGYIKKYARNSINFYHNKYSQYLNPKCTNYKKLSKIEKKFDLIDNALDMELLGWKESKLYKKEVERISKLMESYNKEFESLENKLPLLKRLHNYDDIVYYLKLEKIIK